MELSRGQGAKRGEKESVLQVLHAVAGREPPLTPAAGSKPPAAIGSTRSDPSTWIHGPAGEGRED